jgi:hypothetical protein
MTNIRKSAPSATGGWFPRKRRQRRETIQTTLATSPPGTKQKGLSSTPAAKPATLPKGQTTPKEA